MSEEKNTWRAERARTAGSTKSDKKAAASKRNGRLGGRTPLGIYERHGVINGVRQLDTFYAGRIKCEGRWTLNKRWDGRIEIWACGKVWLSKSQVDDSHLAGQWRLKPSSVQELERLNEAQPILAAKPPEGFVQMDSRLATMEEMEIYDASEPENENQVEEVLAWTRASGWKMEDEREELARANPNASTEPAWIAGQASALVPLLGFVQACRWYLFHVSNGKHSMRQGPNREAWSKLADHRLGLG